MASIAELEQRARALSEALHGAAGEHDARAEDAEDGSDAEEAAMNMTVLLDDAGEAAEQIADDLAAAND